MKKTFCIFALAAIVMWPLWSKRNALQAAESSSHATTRSAQEYVKLADAYRAELKIYTKDKSPREWARTQSNLGKVLLNHLMLGELEDGASLYQMLGSAKTAYCATLEVYAEETSPQEWADAQFGLAIILAEMGRHDLGDELQLFNRAKNARCAALKIFKKDTLSQEWAEVQNQQARAFANNAQFSTDPAKQARLLNEAVVCYKTVLALWSEDGAPRQYQIAKDGLTEIRKRRQPATRKEISR